MTQDKQNLIDMRRMAEKRSHASELLEDFREWYGLENVDDSHVAVIVFGLYRDIMRGTESELNRLIENLEERNSRALMKKLEG